MSAARMLPYRRFTAVSTKTTRLWVTSLEERAVPAVMVVTNLNNSGAGSFRQAVLDANAAAGSDTIDLTGLTGTIGLAGQVTISDTTTILGPGSAKLTLANTAASAATSRVLNVNSATAGASLTMSGVTLTGGKLSTGNGGGMLVQDEDITLSDIAITGNTAGAGDGGGFSIAVGGNKVSMVNCVVSTNEAIGGSSQGGGIFFLNPASFTLQRSTVSGNKSGEDGGGIYFLSGGTLLMEDSTVSGNQANQTKTRQGGGGLYLFGNTFNGTIRNSTISANSAKAGGGVTLRGSGNLTIQNTTLAFNAATDKGGAIYNQSTMSLASSIVANNTAPTGPEVQGSITANFSLFGNGTGISITGANNVLNVDPMLKALASNGGATQTHALSTASPAIDKGSNPAALSTDQRGTTRVIGTAADIGAYEMSFAKTFVVINTLPSGPGSLPQAIIDANLNPGADTIDLSGVTGVINIPGGQMTIGDDVTLIGPGSSLLTIANTAAPSDTSRIFNVTGPGNINVLIQGVTLTGGQLTSGNGGAILGGDENITLIDVVVTANQTADDGGGIAVNGGSLSMDHCVISNNQATGSNSQGGGVLIGAPTTVSITDSTISGNKAGEDGGGLYFAAGGSLTMSGVTISGNQANTVTAGDGGGGLFATGAAFNATIRSSTFSGNSATNGGGFTLTNAATANAQNCTVAFNSASVSGGGFHLVAANLTLAGSLVAKNTAPVGPDLDGPATANFSLVGDTSGASLSGANNVLNVDPLLRPLANYGGFTQTHALRLGSPALNVGTNAAGTATDQRGTGFSRTVSGQSDIGAFEFQNLPTVIQVVINGGAVQRSRVTTVAVTFSHVVTLPANPADAFQLTRQSDGAIVGLNAAISGTTVTLTFTGSNSEFGSLADGRYNLTVRAANVSTIDGQLDGNDNSIPGDDYVLVGNTTNKLCRLFGDADGDGDTDNTDFVLFRTSYGNGAGIFDFDGDGDTDLADFVAFRNRFGTTLP